VRLAVHQDGKVQRRDQMVQGKSVLDATLPYEISVHLEPFSSRCRTVNDNKPVGQPRPSVMSLDMAGAAIREPLRTVCARKRCFAASVLSRDSSRTIVGDQFLATRCSGSLLCKPSACEIYIDRIYTPSRRYIRQSGAPQISR
jgi:hypothetical protein